MSPATVRFVAVDWECGTFARYHGAGLALAGTSMSLAAPFASGASGMLHAVGSSNGQALNPPIVAKVFDPAVLHARGGAAQLIARVDGLSAALDATGDPTWPDAVLALPFAVATVELAGRREVVSLMLDLHALGYTAPEFAEPATTGRYMARETGDRIDIALRFAERCSLLERIGFVHGDLNPDNVMINLGSLDVQIVDFDGGVVVRRGNERAVAPDGPDDCVPPEVVRNEPGRQPFDVSRFTAAAERWSIGSLVGYAVAGAHPVFFLEEISPGSIDAYASEPGGWPEIDTGGPLFTTLPQNQRAYERMADELAGIPDSARDAFRSLFAAGLRGDVRPTAAGWTKALEGLRKPPVIDDVEVDETYVVEGSAVTLSWTTRDASRVEIGSLGQHPASGSITTVVSVGTVFTVRAFNARGEWVERSSPEIRVVPLPRLDTIPVPEFGGLSLRFTYPPQLLGDVFGAGAEDAATSQPLPAPRLARSFAVQPLHHPDDPVARGHAAPRLTHSLAVQPLADRGDAAAMPPAAPLPSRVFGEPGPLWPIFRRHTNADEGG